MSGLFIVLEGIEGSGKSTQARLLGDWLEAAGVAHVLTREPGGTRVGEAIRRIVLEGDDVAPRAELLLMLAARATLLAEVVRPALDAGKVVVADRFDLSSLAYQGYGRGLPLDEVRRINAFATDDLRPDLTLLLELPTEAAEARRLEAGRRPDRIEQAGGGFHTRVAEAYRLLAAREPGMAVVDAAGPVERVQAALRAELHARFPETFPQGSGIPGSRGT